MAEVYEASEETKRIIEDWANAPFVWGEMPDVWFKKQKQKYRAQFELEDRERNLVAWKEAETLRRHFRKRTPKAKKKKVVKIDSTTLPLTISEDPEHIYVVRIEGNSNVTGYGYTTTLANRATEHIRNAEKDGSTITEWNTFGFEHNVAKAVEKIVINRFPLEICTIPGFMRESTGIDRYEEVVDFVDQIRAFLAEPIKASEVTFLH